MLTDNTSALQVTFDEVNFSIDDRGLGRINFLYRGTPIFEKIEVHCAYAGNIVIVKGLTGVINLQVQR